MEESRLPRSTYVLAAGATELVPPDYFDLADAAGGADALPGWFARRLGQELATRGLDASPDRVATEWDGYLSGEYGACLRRVSPEGIAEKARLMAAIERRDRDAAARRRRWRAALREACRSPRRHAASSSPRGIGQRFGGPVSRDRLVTAVRARFAAAWPGPGA